MTSPKTKLAAVLATAALLSPSALAGGDGKPCFWKDAAHQTRTVAETPVPAEPFDPAEFVGPLQPAEVDENAVVRLDDEVEFSESAE